MKSGEYWRPIRHPSVRAVLSRSGPPGKVNPKSLQLGSSIGASAAPLATTVTVGSNNLPLLVPQGMFGTRIAGGKDAAVKAARGLKRGLPKGT